jgi:putative hydrolase of the HAD superfamily
MKVRRSVMMVASLLAVKVGRDRHSREILHACRAPREVVMQRLAVLFDFGGTLDADGLRWSVRVHSAYRDAGGALALEEFEPLFRQSDRRLEQLPGIRTMGLKATALAQATILNELLDDDQELDVNRAASLFVDQSLDTARRNRPLLEALSRRARLGVVSNFSGNLDRCLEDLGLLTLFDVTLDSAVVGLSKPAPEIFLSALERLDVAPEDAWMVGDNFEADIRPAAALGLSTCWLAPPDRREPEAGVATARLATLVDLPTVIG